MLPEQLRENYDLVTNQRLFYRTLFFGKLKRSTLDRLSVKLKSEVYYPGGTIPTQEGNFIILDEGTVGFAYQRKGATING